MTRIWNPLLLVAVTSAVVSSFSVLPSTSRTFTASAFTRGSSLYMASSSSTTSPDEWELPDEAPEGGAGRKNANSAAEVEEMSETSLQRLQAERKMESKFVTGDDLHRLRQDVLGLRHELEHARRRHDVFRAGELERKIFKAQQKDAEFVYAVALELLDVAEEMKTPHELEQLREDAIEARNALPQFNLEGLWVGKYSEHGYEMINVTYVGDTLLAEKVTGDKNVPKGELSFKADLSPRLVGDSQVLEPIELGDFASEQWGTKYLSRYSGEGQVAGEGFSTPQFMEGQLIMVNEYFSFAWVPIAHQVFFGRPSPELTLKLLREQHSEVDQQREYLARCMEETEHIEEEFEETSTSLNQHNYYDQEGSFE